MPTPGGTPPRSGGFASRANKNLVYKIRHNSRAKKMRARRAK